MKKTIQLLKDAKTVKKALAFSFVLAFCLEIVFIITLKIGIRKYYLYLDPMDWSELYIKLPRLALLGIGFFIIAFFLELHEKKEDRSFLICERCLNLYYYYQVENGVCPDCSGKVEKLKGFYDRHPKLKRRKRRRVKL